VNIFVIFIGNDINSIGLCCVLLCFFKYRLLVTFEIRGVAYR